MKKQTAIGLFLGGAAVGAGLALLFAPAPGSETRKKVGGWLGEVKEKGKELVEKGKVEAGHKKEQLTAAFRAGKEAYDASKTFENGKTREKIAA
jgi:gas vesicle protein